MCITFSENSLFGLYFYGFNLTWLIKLPPSSESILILSELLSYLDLHEDGFIGTLEISLIDLS